MTQSLEEHEQSNKDLNDNHREMLAELRPMMAKLPPGQRIQVQLDMRELKLRLRRVALSKEYYEHDLEEQKRIKREAWKYGATALVIIGGLQVVEFFQIVELDPISRLIVLVFLGAGVLVQVLSYAGQKNLLAVSTRQYNRDEEDLVALGANTSNTEQFNAALEQLNEFLAPTGGREFACDLNFEHYRNLLTEFRLSVVDDYLKALED